jgi:hypothetical protein
VLITLDRLDRSATPAPELSREPVEVRVFVGVCGGSFGIFESLDLWFGDVGRGEPALFTRWELGRLGILETLVGFC